MFCFQCQETLKNTGCTTVGVCGKSDEVATLQDLLTFVLKGVSFWAERAHGLNLDTTAADEAVMRGLFATITNANFDPQWFEQAIEKALTVRNRLKTDVLNRQPDLYSRLLPAAATWEPIHSPENPSYSEEMRRFGSAVGILSELDPDKRSLKELITYGLKGICAYGWHANALGYRSDSVRAEVHHALAQTLRVDASVEDLVALALKTGATAVGVMQLLDEANTTTFGHPEASQVFTRVGAGPRILVSGHDLHDLLGLLRQTEGTGIQIYTHGEMLPAHGYPGLKRFPHLAGHFGTAWQNQLHEFDAFGGPVLLTTNCLVPPRDSYKARVFTTGVVGFPGLRHIAPVEAGEKDFSALIEAALQLKDLPAIESDIAHTVGFGHHQVMSVADRVVGAIHSGDIKRFVVMAGCEGRHKERAYYEEVTKQLPQDTVILTAGCAKFRYNHLELGTTGGIPRLLDAGQCNDSYSLATIALKLKDAFGLSDINELPISYDIAWYEQKAVCVLLALLHLGVKGIRLGPTLPAFLSPNVASLLVEHFQIAGIQTPEEDIEAMLQPAA
jgi:hydroxylamine reductase